MALALAVKMSNSELASSISLLKGVVQNKLHYGCNVNTLPTEEAMRNRRLFLGCGTVPLVTCLLSSLVVTPAWAVDESKDKEDGLIGSIASFFNPNEKTKSGIVLPKDYLKSAREVVRTLRDSLKETPKDITEFRRNADAAKEAIREYLNEWKGQKTVVNEESYAMIEKAIRSLAKFYSKAGPSATLPEDIKSEIIGALDMAQQFL
ncbi:hypothetical protein Leryth_021551 [Lithospermum erythrorhizon]|uniref:Uncharacterized protein n=1 Tax=Lithospermum erythrorhizon TaxID=34254 RepID=A0AAV3RY69_LITER|nr:hypothetical protein Leryth_021551 [Lithospermum erythrorhizon]